MRTRDCRFFDISSTGFRSCSVIPGDPAVIYHPNIQSCRNIDAVMHYVKKGGKYITNIDVQVKRWLSKDSNPFELKERSATKDEWLTNALLATSWQGARSFNGLSSTADFLYRSVPPPPFEPKYKPEDFEIPPVIKDWVAENLPEDKENVSCSICGDDPFERRWHPECCAYLWGFEMHNNCYGCPCCMPDSD